MQNYYVSGFKTGCYGEFIMSTTHPFGMLRSAWGSREDILTTGLLLTTTITFIIIIIINNCSINNNESFNNNIDFYTSIAIARC